MIKCRLPSPFVQGVKQIFATNSQNVRWVTSVSVDFDDAALAAARPFEEIPTDLELPWVGTGWIYFPIIGYYDIKRMSVALIQKKNRLGNIYREKFGKFRMVCTFDADDMVTMYKHEGAYPSRNDIESIRTYRESRKQWFKRLGLTLLNGKDWYDLRTKAQKHLMKPVAVQAYLNPMQEVAHDLVKKIRVIRDSNNEIQNFEKELYKWALESIAIVGLDTRLGCLDLNLSPDSDGIKMINCLQTCFECVNNMEAFSGSLQLWKYFPTPLWKKFVEASDTFTSITFKHINRSLEKLKNAPEDHDLTLLQALTTTKGMDLSDAMGLVSDMLGAGIDTTSNTMGFFFYNMARNPEKQEILYQNLKQILPSKDDKITPTIFNELKYLKACIKESQRLIPVVGAHVRTVDHDVVLSGYRIPAGTVILAGIHGIFGDERYFSNPAQYLPERWLKKDERFHPYAFLPFGFGVRSCVGRRLAELEMICLAAELMRNFKVEYHYEDIGLVTRLINAPDKPLRFKFIER